MLLQLQLQWLGHHFQGQKVKGQGHRGPGHIVAAYCTARWLNIFDLLNLWTVFRGCTCGNFVILCSNRWGRGNEVSNMWSRRAVQVSERCRLDRTRVTLAVVWNVCMSRPAVQVLFDSRAVADWKQRSPNRQIAWTFAWSSAYRNVRRAEMTTSGCCDQLTVASEVHWQQSVHRLVRQQCQLELYALPDCKITTAVSWPVWCDRGDEFPTQGILHGLKALE